MIIATALGWGNVATIVLARDVRLCTSTTSSLTMSPRTFGF
jgi:hypothetical protein